MLSPIYTKSPWQETYSEIIDVRSEDEFAEDCIPGAINLPVLNNHERAKVGTIYKQESPFQAKKIGSAIVAQNIAKHLHNHFINKDKKYFPLIYCWRGGQRSYSLALVLTQIGWQVTLLEGGYKTYRAYVREQLNQLPNRFTYKVLCGLTGTGKTHILHQLQLQGVQVLDLERLANHRGSLLGQEWNFSTDSNDSTDFDSSLNKDNREKLFGKDKPSPQPSQKRFESLLLQELQRLDCSKTVWVESESNKIGQVHLPIVLWEKMKQANCVLVQLPKQQRIAWLLQQYPHLGAHPETLKEKLNGLKSRYGGEKLQQWYDWIDRGEWEVLVGDLLEYHYDPGYYRSLNKTYKQIELELPLADLSLNSIETALDVLCQRSYSATRNSKFKIQNSFRGYD